MLSALWPCQDNSQRRLQWWAEGNIHQLFWTKAYLTVSINGLVISHGIDQQMSVICFCWLKQGHRKSTVTWCWHLYITCLQLPAILLEISYLDLRILLSESYSFNLTSLLHSLFLQHHLQYEYDRDLEKATTASGLYEEFSVLFPCTLRGLFEWLSRIFV